METIELKNFVYVPVNFFNQPQVLASTEADLSLKEENEDSSREILEAVIIRNATGRSAYLPIRKVKAPKKSDSMPLMCKISNRLDLCP